MITTILQEKLREGIAAVEKVSAKSLTLPILNNILITAEKNFLNLAATDLETGISWWGLAKTEKEGAITIPSRLFSGFISLLPNKKINLEVKNNTLFVVCDNYKTQIKGLPAEDFPIIPKISAEESIIVNGRIFCQNLGQVVDIAAPSTARPEISGIYFYFQKNYITMTATDSFRLAEKKLTLKSSNSLKKDWAIILPQKTAKEIINIFGDKGGEVRICLGLNQIMVDLQMAETKHPEVQVVSRLIEGEYPNYQEIIPQKNDTQFVINKGEFLNQIKSASLFSGKVNEVKVRTDSKKSAVEIISQNPEIGEYQSVVPAKIKGAAVEVAFNHKFLLDGVANIKSAEVVLELNGNSGPGVLRPVGDNTYIYVVMPIKAS